MGNSKKIERSERKGLHLNLNLSEDTVITIRLMSAMKGMSISDYITEILEDTHRKKNATIKELKKNLM